MPREKLSKGVKTTIRMEFQDEDLSELSSERHVHSEIGGCAGDDN